MIDNKHGPSRFTVKKALLYLLTSLSPLTPSILTGRNYPNLGNREIKSLVTHVFGWCLDFPNLPLFQDPQWIWYSFGVECIPLYPNPMTI